MTDLNVYLYYGGKGWYAPRREDGGLCYCLVGDRSAVLDAALDRSLWPALHITGPDQIEVEMRFGLGGRSLTSITVYGREE
jgi:hypothetical protein